MFLTSGQWVEHTYTDVRCCKQKDSKRNREETRRCTEANRGTGASKKKPAGSSTERIGTAGERLSHDATALGREIYW